MMMFGVLAFAAVAAFGPLDYFKGTALHDADMRGISGKIDEILARAPAEFEFARTLAERRGASGADPYDTVWVFAGN